MPETGKRRRSAGGFRPIEPPMVYGERGKNFDLLTTVTFQRGLLGGRPAVRFYWEGRTMATRASPDVEAWTEPPKRFRRDEKLKVEQFHKSKRAAKDKRHVAWNSPVFRQFGGKSLQEAQYLREDCLTEIVKRLLARRGFSCEEQPKLANKTPDLLACREGHPNPWYVEIKAYHEEVICGEPEIFQALEYAHLASESSGSGLRRARALLVTSGRLVDRRDAAFYKSNPARVVKRRYGSALGRLGPQETLDARGAAGMYRGALAKAKKIDWELASRQRLYWLHDHKRFFELLNDPGDFDALLVPAKGLERLLEAEGMKEELRAFRAVRRTPLERIMIDPDVLRVG
ncbi:MAG: hypothetical protein Kow0069_22370 [Promethearchaeota archaeon]